MTQKLEDVITYLETQLATITDLEVSYTDADETPPFVDTYGAHIYWTPGEFKEQERRHIGDILTEIWTINLDIIINRHFQTQRKAVSDDKGVSYWDNTITDLLLNGTNSGVFESSQWEFKDMETNTDNYTLKGAFTCEIVNNYS